MVNVVEKPHGFCGVPSTQKHPVLACLTMASWLKVTIGGQFSLWIVPTFEWVTRWSHESTQRGRFTTKDWSSAPSSTRILEELDFLVSKQVAMFFLESGSWKWFWRRLLCTWWKFNEIKFPQWNFGWRIFCWIKHFTGGYGWYLPWVLIRYDYSLVSFMLEDFILCKCNSWVIYDNS